MNNRSTGQLLVNINDHAERPRCKASCRFWSIWSTIKRKRKKEEREEKKEERKSDHFDQYLSYPLFYKASAWSIALTIIDHFDQRAPIKNRP